MRSLSENTIISLRHVTMQYDRRAILRDIDLNIDQGDFLAITGPNGGGKTTLLRLILKLLQPTKGNVNYLCNGAKVSSLSIGYLPQKNMIDNRFPVTVDEVMSFGLLAKRHLDKEERRSKVEAMLELLGLTGHAGHAIGELSGGQLQRALIGRALISSPDLLVLDEPLSYLDKNYEHKLYEIIEGLKPSTTIILVSHEMSKISEMATRHIIVDSGINECKASHHYAQVSCDRIRL